MEDALKTISIDTFDLIIARPTPHEAPYIIDFLNEVAEETDFLTFAKGEFPFSVVEEQEIITECLEANRSLMLIGKINDLIISQLFLDRSKKKRLSHIGDISITVSKKYWGKSIGKHMMQAAIEWAKLNNITKLQLQVLSDNERALKLYNKLGFVIEGKISRALKIHNVYFDDYLMGLLL